MDSNPSITINGKKYMLPGGSTVSVVNNEVWANGQKLTSLDEPDGAGEIKLLWEGTAPLSLSVSGDFIRSLQCGDVAGNVSGSNINCNNISGDVNCGGSVNCKDVGGSVDAGGSVTCKNIGAGVKAGGSVVAKNIINNNNPGNSGCNYCA